MLFLRIRQKAFTLIELLVVVAIISILAAIALPNFLHAQVRAKIARVSADFRTISTAITLYRLDHNAYPPIPIYESGISCIAAYSPLTTPTSYISSSIKDPFQKGIRPPKDYYDESFVYWGEFIMVSRKSIMVQQVSRYWLQSFGPDRTVDGINPPFYYQSSNGLTSNGDIVYDGKINSSSI